jgi:hypothetical protein
MRTLVTLVAGLLATLPSARRNPAESPCAVRVRAQRGLAQALCIRRGLRARPAEHVGFREAGRARNPRAATNVLAL